MNTRLVCFAAIVLLGFAVSNAVAQTPRRSPAPKPPRRPAPAPKTPAVTPGPPDCSKLPGCDTCAPGRTARAAPRCSACKPGFTLRGGSCNTCAPGFAGRSAAGAKFAEGCGACGEGAMSAGGPMSSTQCRKCPNNAVVVNGKCGCAAGMRLVTVFGIMSCQPCIGMSYSDSGNTGAACKTCARGQVPTQERDGCVNRADPAAMAPVGPAIRLPAPGPPPVGSTPAAGTPSAQNIISALLRPLTDGRGGVSADNTSDEEDYGEEAPTMGSIIEDLGSALDDRLFNTDLPAPRDGTLNLEATNQRVEAQLRAGNAAGALKTVMDEIVGGMG